MDSNFKLFQRYPHDMHRNNILPSIWASPFKLIHKSMHLIQLMNRWAEVGVQFFCSLPSSFPPPVSFLHTQKLLNEFQENLTERNGGELEVNDLQVNISQTV